MFDYESRVLATKLIKDEALYLGVFDVDSPANTAKQWENLSEKARRDAGRKSWQALFHFNGGWVRLAEKGELLSWITLFDGVFKVELRLLSENPQIAFKESETNFFLGEGKFNRLYCPSGKIAVASLGDLGTDLIIPMAIVEAGCYKAAFYCDDQENDHYFLEDESEYPAGDGPDWIIYLQREI
jgi:hypothetical protein